MKQKDHKIIAKSKKNLAARLERRGPEAGNDPVMRGGNYHYEMAERTQALPFGGLGAMHQMTRNLKLDREINRRVKLLKVHNPYYESDHVLNLAYNVLCNGTCIEDLELRRQSTEYMNALGARSILDPTTAGDFLRRFDEASLVELLECINDTRERVWAKQPAAFFERAVVDIDATIAPTLGECKEGMDLSYKGKVVPG